MKLLAGGIHNQVEFAELSERPLATMNNNGARFFATDTGVEYINWDANWVACQKNTWDGWHQDQIADGECVLPRTRSQSNSVAMNSGTLRLSYFTAQRTEVITVVRMFVGAVAASSTPTLSRIGIWAADPQSGALQNMEAWTSNDPNLFTGSTFGMRSKALQSSFFKTRGATYAIGALTVTSGTTAQFAGMTMAVAAEADVAPKMFRAISSISDLPNELPGNALTQSNSGAQFHLVR